MSELLTYLQSTEPQFRKARLAALYSDFRHLKSTNPDGYNANISAWRKGLAAAARAGILPSEDLVSINIDEELLHSLNTPEWGRPLSLGTVVREAVGNKDMIMYKDFMAAQDSIYKRSWSIPIPSVGDVLGWGLRQLGLIGNEDRLVVGRVVVMENLEEAGKVVASRMSGVRGRVERIFSIPEFSGTFNDVLGKDRKLSNGDMELLLKFLERDKQVLAFDGETIKVKAPGEKTPGAITSEDGTIANLKTLIKDLEVQTRVLTTKVDELNMTAKEAVERKNRIAALAALRSKKLSETTLSKRHATLAQLEDVFAKIEQAADQLELINVMEGSTKVLQGFNKEIGGVNRVDDVVDQLREQMTQVDEVGNVIAEVGSGAIDETEVDEELEAMEGEEREKVETKQRAEREENEKKEAAETKGKLDELKEIERKAEAGKPTRENELRTSTEDPKQMSLEQEKEPALEA